MSETTESDDHSRSVESTLTSSVIAPTGEELSNEDSPFIPSSRTSDNRTITDQPAQSSVIAGIPAYNEASSIASVSLAVAEHVDEVVVVDDGSSDETVEQATSASATVIQHEENKGYGAALASLFGYANERDADHLIILDGDGQHDPDDVPELLREQKSSGAEIVIGSRFVGTKENETPLYRKVGLAIVNSMTNLGFRFSRSPLRIADTQSGFRAYDKTAIQSLAARDEIGTGMDASLGILFHAAGEDFSVEEIPTTVDYDVEDPNSHHPITHGLTLVKRILVEMVKQSRRATIGLTTIALGVLGFLFIGSGVIDQSLIGISVIVGILVFSVVVFSAGRSQFRSLEQ